MVLIDTYNSDGVHFNLHETVRKDYAEANRFWTPKVLLRISVSVAYDRSMTMYEFTFFQ